MSKKLDKYGIILSYEKLIKKPKRERIKALDEKIEEVFGSYKEEKDEE